MVDYPVLQRRGYCYDTDVWAMNGQIHEGRGIDKKKQRQTVSVNAVTFKLHFHAHEQVCVQK